MIGGVYISYLVSIILPTRHRPEMLLKSIKSLLNNARDINKIQILLKIDDDDYSYWNHYPELYKLTPHIKILISPRNNGYNDLHKYINDLCSISEGKYLFVWNDDAIMQTDGWDEIIEENEKGLFGDPIQLIVFPTNRLPGVFPLVHRKIYEILGHLSCVAHTDAWIGNVTDKADLMRYEPRLMATHDRFDITGNNDDKTYNSGLGDKDNNPYLLAGETWVSMEMILQRLEDINKLRHYFDKEKIDKSSYIKSEANLSTTNATVDVSKIREKI